ncbi:MAG TPA: methylated-DNA--[protein]-cysteine S-methyltransferase [Thermoanaerobaculia bacterium]|nr:methylated-DNA--[protein]-cysteine S-methyltransferase [Thermoanaerobaculia bacterium]
MDRSDLPGAGASLRVLMPSPIGPLGVELRQTAVTRLIIDPVDPERSTFTPLHEIDGSDFLDEVFGRLAEYFAGARRKLEVEFNLTFCGRTGFARRVLKQTAKIPYGKTRTFQGIAEMTGRSGAQALVIQVLLENPIPIIIGCHRVVLGQSLPGGYVGGTERKLWLLQLESNPQGVPPIPSL